jgi:hypothetical protein
LNRVYEAARALQEFCGAQDWRFCFIGAIAIQRWGEPRLTQVVDVTLLTRFRDEEGFAARLLSRFRGRIQDAGAFALKSRVLLLWSSQGIGMDVALGGLPFEEHCVERASDFEIAPGISITTCSAEDLIVLKAFAGRPKDWEDVQGIATRHTGRLDTALIFRELDPLLELKDDAAARERLRQILADA